MKAVYIGSEDHTSEMVTLALRLRWSDITPLIAYTAEEGLDLVKREMPDVVLMHLDVEDLTLGKAIKEIRRLTTVPLLVLGEAKDKMAVVAYLDLGADDYVRLPCDLTEIMVRVRAKLRRAGAEPLQASEGALRSGALFINPTTYELSLGEQRVRLSSTEFKLLRVLIMNRETTVPHQTLERELWGEHVVSSQRVKKYVQRLRRKLGDDAREPIWVANVFRVGYRFIGPPAEIPQPR